MPAWRDEVQRADGADIVSRCVEVLQWCCGRQCHGGIAVALLKYVPYYKRHQYEKGPEKIGMCEVHRYLVLVGRALVSLFSASGSGSGFGRVCSTKEIARLNERILSSGSGRTFANFTKSATDSTARISFGSHACLWVVAQCFHYLGGGHLHGVYAEAACR